MAETPTQPIKSTKPSKTKQLSLADHIASRPKHKLKKAIPLSPDSNYHIVNDLSAEALSNAGSNFGHDPGQVSTTDVSSTDWATVKWHLYQNDILAFKEHPDNLLAYVVVARSKTNIKVMNAEDSACKTVIKGFQRDIIEVKWNNCFYSKTNSHLNILSALDSSGTLFIYEIREEKDPKTGNASLHHNELATFFCHKGPVTESEPKIYAKIEVYDEVHSFILLIYREAHHENYCILMYAKKLFLIFVFFIYAKKSFLIHAEK